MTRRQSGAIKKVATGANRILSNMAADTLVLAKTAQPFRILYIDDEDWRLDYAEAAIHAKLTNVSIKKFKNDSTQTFQDSEVWQELQRTDPDLLITDDIMGGVNGHDIVRRLNDKKVTYPIIVINSPGLKGWEWVLEYTAKSSNVSFLHCPYTPEQLCNELSKHLGSKLQFQNSKS